MKGYSGAHSGPGEIGNIFKYKTGEKLSEKLLFDVCIPLRMLYLFSRKAVFEHCSCKSESDILQHIEDCGEQTNILK